MKYCSERPQELRVKPKFDLTNTIGKSGKTEIEEVSFDEVFKLHKLLQGMVKFTDQLEADPDFSDLEIQEWHDSMSYVQRRLSNLVKKGDLYKKWERREAKIEEMIRIGVLEDGLAKRWKMRQATIKEAILDVQEVY